MLVIIMNISLSLGAFREGVSTPHTHSILVECYVCCSGSFSALCVPILHKTRCPRCCLPSRIPFSLTPQEAKRADGLFGYLFPKSVNRERAKCPAHQIAGIKAHLTFYINRQWSLPCSALLPPDWRGGLQRGMYVGL